MDLLMHTHLQLNADSASRFSIWSWLNFTKVSYCSVEKMRESETESKTTLFNSPASLVVKTLSYSFLITSSLSFNILWQTMVTYSNTMGGSSTECLGPSPTNTELRVQLTTLHICILIYLLESEERLIFDIWGVEWATS